MKNKIICITSLAKKTRVTIRNGQRTKSYLLGSIDEAKTFVLPFGNRHTTLFLNGYKCVLGGWVL